MDQAQIEIEVSELRAGYIWLKEQLDHAKQRIRSLENFRDGTGTTVSDASI